MDQHDWRCFGASASPETTAASQSQELSENEWIGDSPVSEQFCPGEAISATTESRLRHSRSNDRKLALFGDATYLPSDRSFAE